MRRKRVERGLYRRERGSLSLGLLRPERLGRFVIDYPDRTQRGSLCGLPCRRDDGVDHRGVWALWREGIEGRFHGGEILRFSRRARGALRARLAVEAKDGIQLVVHGIGGIRGWSVVCGRLAGVPGQGVAFGMSVLRRLMSA